MSSGLRSTSSSPSRKSMAPFSGNDSLELQRRNPSRVPASGGMHSGSLTDKDGILAIVRHLPETIVSREGSRGQRGPPRPPRRGKEPRSGGMLAPRGHARRLVARLALAATIGGSAACSGGPGGGAAPLRLVF